MVHRIYYPVAAVVVVVVVVVVVSKSYMRSNLFCLNFVYYHARRTCECAREFSRVRVCLGVCCGTAAAPSTDNNRIFKRQGDGTSALARPLSHFRKAMQKRMAQAMSTASLMTTTGIMTSSSPGSSEALPAAGSVVVVVVVSSPAAPRVVTPLLPSSRAAVPGRRKIC